jgi:hypothetical protein
VDHPRAPEQRAVGVDYGRTIERPVAVALVTRNKRAPRTSEGEGFSMGSGAA